MRHNQVIYLISVTVPLDESGHPQTDDVGNPITVETERKVYANEFSVSSSEHYNAALTGLRPAKMFEVHAFEYQQETKLRHGATTYNIIRSEGKGEKTRLTCEKVAAND